MGTQSKNRGWFFFLILGVGSGTSHQAYAESSDPVLPRELRAKVRSASQAERDPKRGTPNALEILKAEKERVGAHARLVRALDLRIAATVLRNRFLHAKKTPAQDRIIQAISTFSRLELTEPGLRAWIDQSFPLHPRAQRLFSKTHGQPIHAAVLTRGATVPRALVAKTFKAVFSEASIPFLVVPLKNADFVIKAGARDALTSQDERAVRVAIHLEHVKNGSVVWQHALTRTVTATPIDAALHDGLTWLAKVGGRDLFFQWLSDHAFPKLARMRPPGTRQRSTGLSGITPAGTTKKTPLRVRLQSPPSPKKGSAP